MEIINLNGNRFMNEAQHVIKIQCVSILRRLGIIQFSFNLEMDEEAGSSNDRPLN